MKNNSLLKRAACVGIVAGLAGLPSMDAAAQKVDFADKRVELIVPFAPGGGADTYARALAPHLEKHLPGHPTIIVRNIPGGGSVPGANQFEARAKPDGLTALAVSSSTVFNSVFAKKKVKYQVNGWQPVVLSPQGTVVYLAAGLGVQSAKDIAKLKNQNLKFGGKTPTSSEMRMALAMELLGIDVNFIWGVERGEARLAMERGEFNISYDTTPAYNKHVVALIKSGKFVPLFTFGVLDNKGNYVRDPNFPDLPSFVEVYEMVHGKKPSGAPFEAFRTVFQMAIMASKGLVLPAGTPQPVVDAWRTAVKGILDDPEFEKTAASIVENYPQFLGEDVRPILREATEFTPEGWDWLKRFMKT
ncbi:MAG: tricarboxylate transporter, partial [Betaproteobacteria bacterium]|nr:tricarboxylate transporter [Betaproteobacteria bacterium]